MGITLAAALRMVCGPEKHTPQDPIDTADEIPTERQRAWPRTVPSRGSKKQPLAPDTLLKQQWDLLRMFAISLIIVRNT